MWTVLMSAAKSLLKKGQVGVDPGVLEAIQQVRNQVGLTYHVKAAFNAYDGSYEGDNPDCNNSRFTSYLEYAEKQYFSFDAKHWKKMVGIRLGNIEGHLSQAMSGYSAPLAGITEVLKGKSYLFVIVGVIFLLVIVVLIARKSKKR